MAFGLEVNDPDYIDPNKSLEEQEAEARAAEEARLAEEAEAAKAAEEAEAAKAAEEAAKGEGRSADRGDAQWRAEALRRRGEEQRLKEERERQNEELQKLREENMHFKARMDAEREIREGTRRPEDEPPDPETDPYGYQLWQQRQEIKELKAFAAKAKQQEEQQEGYRKQQEENQKIMKEIDDYVTTDITTFKEANPDIPYDEAAKYLREKYVEHWQLCGLTRQEAEAVLANTVFAMGTAAKQRGKSAAEATYSLAQSFGFKPEVEPPDLEKSPTEIEPDAKTKLAKIARGQKLQGLGGKKPAERKAGENIGSMTPEEMANLSDDEYLRIKQSKDLGPLLDNRLRELG